MDNKNANSKNSDTVKLLRECDAGVKMGISSIEEVVTDVQSDSLKNLLNDSKEQHKKLETELVELLDDNNDEGKQPNPIAKSMSWLKSNIKMMANSGDETIADLMTDGCNMGVKSINKYLNKYGNADHDSQKIARRLVQIETKLSSDLSQFL